MSLSICASHTNTLTTVIITLIYLTVFLLSGSSCLSQFLCLLNYSHLHFIIFYLCLLPAFFSFLPMIVSHFSTSPAIFPLICLCLRFFIFVLPPCFFPKHSCISAPNTHWPLKCISFVLVKSMGFWNHALWVTSFQSKRGMKRTCSFKKSSACYCTCFEKFVRQHCFCRKPRTFAEKASDYPG